MFYKKTILYILILFNILLVFSSCSKLNNEKNNFKFEKNELLLHISLSTQYQPQYDFYIDKEYVYYVFKNKELIEKIELSISQKDMINDYINKFNLDKTQNEDVIFDYWTIMIKSERNQKQFTYGRSGNLFIDELTKSILSFSTEKITDESGNEIVEYNDDILQ